MRTFRKFMLGAMVILGVPNALGGCESEPRDFRDDDDGSFNETTTGAGAGSGSGAGSSVAGTGAGSPTSTGSSSGANMCTPGGQSCAAFSECCSGVCDNQVCTTCGDDGDSCGEDGCCQGLTCNPNNDTCGTCLLDGASCSLASDCCSNICDQGTCAAINCDALSCDDCIQGTCAQNACSSQLAACNASPDCAGFLICAAACPDQDQTCLSTCVDTYPDALSAGFPLLSCGCQDNICGAACEGSICSAG